MATKYTYAVSDTADEFGTRTIIFSDGSTCVFFDVTLKPCALCGRRCNNRDLLR